MKLYIAGNESTALCQIGALKSGFMELGHQPVFDITDSDSSFIFVGNGPYETWEYVARSRTKKTIFNVLDCPTWVSEWNDIKRTWPRQLLAADKVTCISNTVKKDLRNLLGVEAETIYYPMKPVRFTGVRKYSQFKVAMVGRLCDPSKRANVAVESLVRAGFKENEVAVIGPEYFGYGIQMGIVNDTILNDIYNSVDYVMMLSRFEGIGLPAIEAACCGTIPVVLPDLTTFEEFWTPSPLGLHYQTLTSPAKVAELIMNIEKNKDWKAQIKQDMLGYAELAFRRKFSARNVAARIIESYHQI